MNFERSSRKLVKTHQFFVDGPFAVAVSFRLNHEVGIRLVLGDFPKKGRNSKNAVLRCFLECRVF
jgi:hypothetical protein